MWLQWGRRRQSRSGTPSQSARAPETFQAAFEVRTNTDKGGKQVRRDCAVCHKLSVLINGREYGDGDAVTLPKGETHTVKVKDTPEPRDTPPGGDPTPPHTSNQKFTVWPKAVDGQTITSIAGDGPADSPQVFIAKKAEILQYLLDNSEGLMAQDKDWPEDPADEPMKKTARLLPIEMKVVDRDDPKKKWGSEKDHNQTKPVYAGESCGDMVSWKLGGTDTWGSTVFTWTAEGPGGETKTGPTGAGKNEWKIADGDDDTANDWLKWKPGKWKIKVQIGSTQAEFEQEVGWRTEDYVVIGQIVETHTHDGAAPPLVAVGNNFWEISSPVALYRRAVLYDMLDLPLFDTANDAIRDALTITPLPITAKLSEAWFGYWYLMSAGLTPKGPFTQAHPSGNGNVQNGHRFWALQHIFNVSPDAPLVQPTFNADTFDTIKDAEQYRVIHRYKSKFVVTSDGKIDSSKVVKINHVAEGGPTKMNFGIAAGEFSPIWNNPAYTFFSLPKQPSETNQYQGAHAVSQDGKKLSYYATGRVGAGGQNVNWRLMGKDAPWIFSEIIVELKPDRTVAAQIKASVDKSWNETTGAVAGETAFNNLNLYKLRRNLQTDEFEFALQELMPMEGELEPFINSASGQRPEPPIPPSVQ